MSATTPAPASRALSASAVARYLKVSRKSVRDWTKAGALPVWFYDDNGRPWYSIATIEAHQRRAGELHAEKVAS